MRILTINCGSSSIKFRILDMADEHRIAEGEISRIGENEGHFRYEIGRPGDALEGTRIFAGHREAIRHILDVLAPLEPPGAVGHRIVHGGEVFDSAVRVDESVCRRIRELIPLAPLHNPSGLTGIEAIRDAWPQLPQVAVFDTAFHRSLPELAWRYPLPEEYHREYGVRRYGFHGISHRYVAEQAAAWLQQPLSSLNLITLHLGHGASAAAIRAGLSIDTSMGMTPLEGLMMGTRCGDLDPAIPEYLMRMSGQSAPEVDRMLNHESGFKGVCGKHDLREVHRLADAGDARARLALDMFSHRLRKYIGAYTALLGRVDALIFTGGIGEHDTRIRAAACAGLDESLGLKIDESSNRSADGRAAAIHAPASRSAILVLPTDEELAIARQTVALLDPADSIPKEHTHE